MRLSLYFREFLLWSCFCQHSKGSINTSCHSSFSPLNLPIISPLPYLHVFTVLHLVCIELQSVILFLLDSARSSDRHELPHQHLRAAKFGLWEVGPTPAERLLLGPPGGDWNGPRWLGSRRPSLYTLSFEAHWLKPTLYYAVSDFLNAGEWDGQLVADTGSAFSVSKGCP